MFYHMPLGAGRPCKPVDRIPVQVWQYKVDSHFGLVIIWVRIKGTGVGGGGHGRFNSIGVR